MNAASLALLLSKEPWNGPIGCCRVGFIDGLLKVNPSLEELNSASNTLNLLYAGTKSRTLMSEHYLTFSTIAASVLISKISV